MFARFRHILMSVLGALLIALLVLSFAVWGIGDIFRGYSRSTIAKIGDSEISADEFQFQYRQSVRALEQRFGERLSNEQLQSFALDRRIISDLISVYGLNEAANKMGLYVSPKAIAEQIVNDPRFRTAGGDFDRAYFQRLLANIGTNEQRYVEEQQGFQLRSQMLSSLFAPLQLPKSFVEKSWQFENENRIVSYITLPAHAVERPSAPSDADLANLYEEISDAFTIAEAREGKFITISPEQMKESLSVSDNELRAAYAERVDSYNQEETRSIEQIRFNSAEEAKKAAKRLDRGTSFETLVEEKGLSVENVSLGILRKSDILTPEIATAAFSLQEGSHSAPISTSFGNFIIRVSKINKGKRFSYQQLRDRLREEILLEQARESAYALSQRIEDARAGGASLEETAQQFGLPLYTLPPATAQSTNPRNGKTVKLLIEHPQVIRFLFSANLNEELPVEETREGSFYWIELTNIIPPRRRSLDEVKNEITDLWYVLEHHAGVERLSYKLVERLNNGESFGAIAKELKTSPAQTKAFNRFTEHPILGTEGVLRSFSLKQGEAGTVSQVSLERLQNDEAKVILFRLENIIETPFPQGDEAEEYLQSVENQNRQSVNRQLIEGLRQSLGVKINEAVLNRLTRQTEY
ncbi:MAG: SurA N-terminal domain-containing protein [Parvibaculales bacterium]